MKSICKLLHFAIIAVNPALATGENTALTQKSYTCPIFPHFAQGASDLDCRAVEKALLQAFLFKCPSNILAASISAQRSESTSAFGGTILDDIHNFLLTYLRSTHADKVVRKLIVRGLFPAIQDAISNAFLKQLQDEYLTGADTILVRTKFEAEFDGFKEQMLRLSKAGETLYPRWFYINYARASLRAVEFRITGKPAVSQEKPTDILRFFNTLVLESNKGLEPSKLKAEHAQQFTSIIRKSLDYSSLLLDNLAQHKEVSGDTDYATTRYPHNNFQDVIAVCSAHILARSLAYHVLVMIQNKNEQFMQGARDILASIKNNQNITFLQLSEFVTLTIYQGDTSFVTKYAKITKTHQDELLTLIADEIKAFQTSSYMKTYNELPINIMLHAELAQIDGIITEKFEALVKYCSAANDTPANYNGVYAEPESRKSTENLLISEAAVINNLLGSFMQLAKQQVNEQLLAFVSFLFREETINKDAAAKQAMLATRESLFNTIAKSSRFMFNKEDETPLPVHTLPLLFSSFFQTETAKMKVLSLKAGVPLFVHKLMTHSLFISPDQRDAAYDSEKSNALQLLDHYCFGQFAGKNTEKMQLSSLLEYRMNQDNAGLGKKIYRDMLNNLFGIIAGTKYGFPVTISVEPVLSIQLSDKDEKEKDRYATGMKLSPLAPHVNNNMDEVLPQMIEAGISFSENDVVYFNNLLALIHAYSCNTKEEYDDLFNIQKRTIPHTTKQASIDREGFVKWCDAELNVQLPAEIGSDAKSVPSKTAELK